MQREVTFEARGRQAVNYLLHPGAMRLAHDARDLDAPRLDLDDEENEVADQASEREHLDSEEVRRCRGGVQVAH